MPEKILPESGRNKMWKKKVPFTSVRIFEDLPRFAGTKHQDNHTISEFTKGKTLISAPFFFSSWTLLKERK